MTQRRPRPSVKFFSAPQRRQYTNIVGNQEDTILSNEGTIEQRGNHRNIQQPCSSTIHHYTHTIEIIHSNVTSRKFLSLIKYLLYILSEPFIAHSVLWAFALTIVSRENVHEMAIAVSSTRHNILACYRPTSLIRSLFSLQWTVSLFLFAFLRLLTYVFSSRFEWTW